jgi:hypothetical protein
VNLSESEMAEVLATDDPTKAPRGTFENVAAVSRLAIKAIEEGK